MSTLRRLLALAGLAAVLLSLLAVRPASAATAQPRPPRAPQATTEAAPRAPVVWDHGLAAAPSRDSAASLVTCYGGARSWDAGPGDTDGEPNYVPSGDDPADYRFPSGLGTYVASNRCNDVNLRVTNYAGASSLHASVCFFPSAGGYFCNQGRTFTAGDTAWRVVATDVLDGTRFEVRISSSATGRLTGQTAY